LGAAGLGYVSAADENEAWTDETGGELWSRARVEDRGPRGVLRLYDAYEHSKEIREKFYRECL
jgi:hypothetical protein